MLDVVYAPWPTPFAAAAQARGARVVSGLEMLLHQAVAQVELMTGRPGPVAEMHAALLKMIGHLPPNQQEVVRLKFQNGFSYREISRITALSVGNVGFLIHTAVARLRTEFAAQRP